MSSKEIALLGTAIAFELAKGKSEEEIKNIKALIFQIQSTLITILHS